MTKKLTWTTLALVAVFAIAVSAVAYTNYAMACDKEAKAKSASATKASSGCCAKSATAASSVACDKSAKTASAGACDKSAKSAKTASASTCSKASAASIASNCCLGKDAVAGYSKAGDDKACCNSMKADAHATALKGIVDEIPYAERHRVVVAGSMECGHCNYSATEHCQPLFKTTDGKVYPLIRSDLVTKMRSAEASAFEVSSSVKFVNGVKYLEVKSYKSL